MPATASPCRPIHFSHRKGSPAGPGGCGRAPAGRGGGTGASASIARRSGTGAPGTGNSGAGGAAAAAGGGAAAGRGGGSAGGTARAPSRRRQARPLASWRARSAMTRATSAMGRAATRQTSARTPAQMKKVSSIGLSPGMCRFTSLYARRPGLAREKRARGEATVVRRCPAAPASGSGALGDTCRAGGGSRRVSSSRLGTCQAKSRCPAAPASGSPARTARTRRARMRGARTRRARTARKASPGPVGPGLLSACGGSLRRRGSLKAAWCVAALWCRVLLPKRSAGGVRLAPIGTPDGPAHPHAACLSSGRCPASFAPNAACQGTPRSTVVNHAPNEGVVKPRASKHVDLASVVLASACKPRG